MSNKINQPLNKEQKEAVEYIDGPLLVIAGAGSGKTRVIIKKIAFLIQTCNIKAQNICAVTFTNKTANEMQTRIHKELPASASRGLKIATFHTLGLRIIKQDHKLLGLRPGFSIFDNEDSIQVIKTLLPQSLAQDKDSLSAILRRISEFKNNLIFPENLNGDSNESINIGEIYTNYQKTLNSYNAVDFDDLITLPVKLLTENPHCREYWQNKIRHLLIDEYQDSNNCQYELVKLLVGVRSKFTAVGDDYQAIYAWRGARPENLHKLSQDFPNLKVVKLEQNYRSTGRILHTANHLIANNSHLFKKKLWSELGPGDPIRIFCCEDERIEAEQIVSDIISHKLRHNLSFNNYALLYRSNHQARIFEKTLRYHNISYQISGGQSWFAKTEIKDILAYLKLLCNNDDDASFLRVINTPKRGIGNKTLTVLGEFAKQRQQSLYSCCDNIGLNCLIEEKSGNALKTFKNWLKTVTERLQTLETIDVLKAMLTEIDYEAYLYEQHSTTIKAQKCIDNVYELLNWINNIIQSEPSNTLADSINKLILIDILDKNQEYAPDSVQLLTLHAAKGLEFPYVYLTGMEEEILPHHVSIENDEVAEERRLAYVGITRAQKRLTLSFAKKRKRAATQQITTPSRFLDELPEDCLEWYGKEDKKNPIKSKEIASLHLSGLKSMLRQNS